MLCPVDAILKEGLSKAGQETLAKTQSQILCFCERVFTRTHSSTVILDMNIQEVGMLGGCHSYRSSAYCSKLSRVLNRTAPVRE